MGNALSLQHHLLEDVPVAKVCCDVQVQVQPEVRQRVTTTTAITDKDGAH